MYHAPYGYVRIRRMCAFCGMSEHFMLLKAESCRFSEVTVIIIIHSFTLI